jgi:hypothetical protein
MKSKTSAAICILALAFLVFKISTASETQSAPDSQIEHGRYLVERVAMCADCHTPRTDAGDYDRTQWLQGDVLGFKPTHPMPFAVVAPTIAGLPSFTNDDLAVRFFETGTNAFGHAATLPMPQFRFNRQDAKAVVAYLRSLKH